MKIHPSLPLLQRLASERILLLDGAMGSMIQQYELGEKDYRGERFAKHPYDLKGNNEMLNLTRPDVIMAIHRAYFEAGSDIIETNTFGATRIAQADYHTEDLAYEQNKAAAEIAKKVAAEFSTPEKPRFVAGALGPTNKTGSISPDVNNPGYRAISFEELEEAYYEEASGLLDGGVDILIVETIFDTLNAKAAIFAIDRLFEERGEIYPVMISGTITDASGRTLSGQTTEAFWVSVKHAKPFSVGINCALGAKEMRPYVETLSHKADCLVSCYPNAGLPNEFGEYDETPQQMAEILKEFASSGFVNILGGCCGSTPEHIKYMADAVEKMAPRKVVEEAVEA